MRAVLSGCQQLTGTLVLRAEGGWSLPSLPMCRTRFLAEIQMDWRAVIPGKKTFSSNRTVGISLIIRGALFSPPLLVRTAAVPISPEVNDDDMPSPQHSVE